MAYFNTSQVVVNARFLTQKITGVQRFAIELSKALKEKRPDITFVAPNNIIHTELADLLDVQIIGKTTNGVIWEQMVLPRYLAKKGKPLLINLGNVAPLFYNNNVVAIYDLAFYLHPEWFSKKAALFYNFLIPLIIKNARYILTSSLYSKNDICKYFNIKEEIVAVLYPTISKIFLDERLEKKNRANSYGDYILAVSSLDPRKNFKNLIKAFKSCKLPATNLVIVGNAHKLFAADEELSALSKNDPTIIFTGYVDDKELVSLYTKAKVFAYPSLFEGFGIPPLEAMACGCLTVVSNVTSLPEACGEASIYVDPFNVDNIKEGLLKSLNDGAERQRLIELGYERVKIYENDESINKLMTIIDSIN